MVTLWMLELSGIQDFVFGTNNLRVNIGASTLIQVITERWIPDLLPEPCNLTAGKVTDQTLEQDGLAVEAIYIGGGNAFLMFREVEHAAALTRKLTRRLLEEAPGLRVVIAQRKIEWERDDLVTKYESLRRELAQRKLQPPAGMPLPGLSVTAACVFTGLPAAHIYPFPGDEKQRVSSSVQARLDHFKYADKYLKDLAPEIDWEWLRPVSDFDYFGSKGESSYIAIVHTDGNRMGERIKKLAEDLPSVSTAERNRQYCNRLRAFSHSAHAAAKEALRATILKLNACTASTSNGKEHYWQRQRGVQLGDQERLPKVKQRRDKHQRPILPFRPIVFGGDDVTFVCDGRLGLALAHHYLTVYGQKTLADNEKAVGRAGVAIVHSHFPFAQGYSLAEELAKRAKQEGQGGTVATLDWHFGVNGIIESLETMRETAYRVREGDLCARPLRLESSDWRQWQTFTELVKAFQLDDEWRGRRNKIKALQSALRGGKAHVKAFLENYSLPQLPALPEAVQSSDNEEIQQTGWQGTQCVYFDALEALDFFVPLEEPIS